MTLLTDPAYRGDAEIPSFDFDGPMAGQGSWPRLVNLDSETEDMLRMWLDEELFHFYLEREDLFENWQRWQDLYWAEPAQKVKNFPFKKAANVVLPLAAIATETIYARMMNTLFSVEPFWSIRPRSREWIPVAPVFEEYLQIEAENPRTLNVYGFCSDALLELIKLGTAVGKSGYIRETKKSLRHVGDGDEETFYHETMNGATLDHVPLGNFCMRFSETDPDDAPWVGEKHEVTWAQLKRMAADGRMFPDAIESIKSYWRETQGSEIMNDETLKPKVQELAHAEPLWNEHYTFHEIWCSFDIDGDGQDEEIVLDYHRESRTFLSIRYNWYDDLHRPYKIGQYHKVEGIWPGIGICKQSEQFQEEATTIHRQRLDNATLANMGMVAIKKNSGYGPDEPIFPGKMWFLDDVSDIAPVKLSEVYPSSYNNEESVVRYYEKRSGVNETILGMPQAGTPATATSDLTRLAEGNKRFDLVLKNVRRWMSALGIDVITNYQIFGNRQVHWIVQGEKAAFTERVFQMPNELVRLGAAVDLTVTDSITNREQEQRQWMSLFQILTNYYQQVFQLAQTMQDPQLLQGIAAKALQSSDEAVRRLLETFTILDTGRFTLTPEQPDANGPNPGTPGGQIAGSQGAGLPPGMASPQGTSPGPTVGPPSTGGGGFGP